MPIADLAREAVVTVSPDLTASDAAVLMAEEGVGSVVVVEDDRPVGLVTDRDLAVEVVATGEDPTELAVEDVMTAEPFTVNVDAGIYEVLADTCEVGVRRVPVVDDDGKLAGIVTLDDFVVLLAGEFDQIAGVVQSESPPY